MVPAMTAAAKGLINRRRRKLSYRQRHSCQLVKLQTYVSSDNYNSLCQLALAGGISLGAVIERLLKNERSHPKEHSHGK